MYLNLLGKTRKPILVRAAVAILLIAILDWRIKGNIPLGFLYLFPMLIVGSALRRWQTGLVALLCTLLTEAYDNYEWVWETGIPRDILVFSAFFGVGLFVYEVVRSRALQAAHLDRIEQEIAARRAAEEQLKILIESSPAAVFTTDSEGVLLLANEAAHRMFGVAPNQLVGRSIGPLLPALVNVPPLQPGSQVFRTSMQCKGVRLDGEVFQAEVWFSTYRTNAGARLAAMVVDSSEDLRDREELSLQQLMVGSRILVGAVSHEIRNVCGAIGVVHQNLTRGGALRNNKDFETLGTLISGLEKIAAMDLRKAAAQSTPVDLEGLLAELRIIVDSTLRDEDISVVWDLETPLPRVIAEPHSLLQVFLNLLKNSERAMRDAPSRALSIQARRMGEQIHIRIHDTGHGVEHPEQLFRPFQQGAQETGLGLYLSRAFLRSFRGDLHHEASETGATFLVELTIA